MKQKTEWVEKHLYRRVYQTSKGESRTLYYVNFVDRRQRRRSFPVGGDLKVAREQLRLLQARNINREDFDADKRPKYDGITFSEWAAIYFKEKVDPDKRPGSIERERRSSKQLEGFFGSVQLANIKRGNITEYRIKRLQQPIRRWDKVVKDSRISFPTVNRELAFLRYLLNLAVDLEIIGSVPSFRKLILSEKSRKRDRVVNDEEYQAILGVMRRPAQRVIIGLYESAMRVGELMSLTWERVDEKAGLIRLRAQDVKEKAARNVPVSPVLASILRELREEQRKVGSIAKSVFTRKGRPIKSIRKAFELACEQAKVEGLRMHDLRHTCITNWAKLGIPAELVMAASGHHSLEMHQRYVNIKEQDIQVAFKNLPTQLQHSEPLENALAASY